MDETTPPNSQPSSDFHAPIPRIMTRDDIINKINGILTEGLKFQQLLWYGSTEEVTKFLNDHPKLAAYRFASFFRFFGHVMPIKVLHKVERGDRITPEHIAKMGLTPKELMRLAGIEEPDAHSSDK